MRLLIKSLPLCTLVLVAWFYLFKAGHDTSAVLTAVHHFQEREDNWREMASQRKSPQDVLTAQEKRAIAQEREKLETELPTAEFFITNGETFSDDGTYRIKFHLSAKALKNTYFFIKAKSLSDSDISRLVEVDRKVHIPAGTMEGEIELKILDKSAQKDLEEIEIQLERAQNARLGRRSSFRLSILDNLPI